MINVLVTACGCPGGPAVIRALKEEFRVVGTDCSATASGRYFADQFYETPVGGHPEFANALIGICDEEGIDIVLPESSHEIMALAEARERFEERGIKVLIGKPSGVETALDKVLTYKILQDVVYLPEWKLVHDESELYQAARHLGYFSGKHIVVKPAKGSGGRGLRVLRQGTDRAGYEMRQWPNSQAAMLEEIHGRWPLLVMEYLHQEWAEADCVDMYASKDGPEFGFTKIRRDCRMGLHYQHQVKWDPGLWEQGCKVVDALGLEGFVNIQFMGGKLLEVNPRISTNFYLEGCNYPLAGVSAALGLSYEWQTPPDGTRMQYIVDNRTF